MRYTPNGIPILELAEIGSTNAEAMRLGLAGTAAPLWVRAERQIAGRGRSGRAWTSEPGNHYASLLIRLTCEPTVLHHLSFVAAVAVVAAVRRVAASDADSRIGQRPTPRQRPAPNPSAHGGGDPTRYSEFISVVTTNTSRAPFSVAASEQNVREGWDGADGCAVPDPRATSLPLRLKWPNDILVDGAKLVGILPESTLLPDKAALAVIGIGINLVHAPAVPGRATTCLGAHGVHVTPAAMLDALAVTMSDALATWDTGAGFAAIRARWLADALPLGTAMAVNAGRDTIDGTFAGLDHDGALILRDHSGYDRRMTFGDVTVTARTSDQG